MPRQPGQHPDPAAQIALVMQQEQERQREQQVHSALRVRAADFKLPPWNYVGGPGQPAFSANWANVPGTLASPARFFRDPLGFVYIAGRVEMTVAGGYLIFTLPVGYRPPNTYTFTVYTSAANPYVEITPDGQVRADFGPAALVDIAMDLPPFRVI